MTKAYYGNDYNHGAHPAIMEALNSTNNNSYDGYGLDPCCEAAKSEIHKYIDCPQADIHFFVGGTQVNYVALEMMLTRPYQTVICADTGHINVHESGAVEHTGHKLHTLKSHNGIITAEQITEEAEYYRSSPLEEHITHPRAVYISYPTEYGTIYSKKELEEIRRVCDEYDMYLFIDGARMGYGLGSNDCDLTAADVARLSDAFYFGGTKCGALFGEALVITNDELKTGVRNYMKLNGAMLAKGWLLGLQFETLFKNGLYFDICRDAVRKADRLKMAFKKAGVEEYVISQTNQLFYIMDNALIDKLSRFVSFEVEDPYDSERTVVRFCTSWSTTDEDINELIDLLDKEK